MATYRSNLVFESIHEADVVNMARSHKADILPADWRTSAVDSGHAVAFYSDDAAHCEAVNAEIASRREASIQRLLESPTFEGDDRPEAEKRAEIEREGWGFMGYTLALTPQRHLVFSGWTKVA